MPQEIITLSDLNQFKVDLINEIKEILKVATSSPTQWLKTHQVREMLGISPGTLQNMRINGTLPYTKIKGIIFYDYNDIVQLMESLKKNTMKR
ncbi:helix-turn-helix domain-containing protein [Chitinophaga oryzae]|uniref:Helix-turn-helix domain-containing protein n=1 Tax=Chitinophaga oryzae TaxID=2725414 RepID=A0AAE6ZDL7_9BACT|nr:helix-turn-helix domain-containing protein [Chitinophaga oryzae]QJB29932.1 helix-turn-helix domain-containing protein [Chitinophaga oryzae]